MYLGKFRKELNITQKEFAERVGVTVAMVNMWEHDKKVPRADNISKILEILGCTFEELMTGDRCWKTSVPPVDEEILVNVDVDGKREYFVGKFSKNDNGKYAINIKGFGKRSGKVKSWTRIPRGI